MADINDGLAEGTYASSAVERIARAQYSFASEGGAVGDIGLGVTLPDNAIVVGGMIETTTTCTSGGSATIALKLNSGGDLSAAAAISGGAGQAGVHDIIPDNTGSTAVKLTAARELTLTVATAALTAGVLNVWLRYFVAE